MGSGQGGGGFLVLSQTIYKTWFLFQVKYWCMVNHMKCECISLSVTKPIYPIGFKGYHMFSDDYQDDQDEYLDFKTIITLMH